MHEQQELVTSVVLGAASCATPMAVVVTVVGAGRGSTGQTDRTPSGAVLGRGAALGDTAWWAGEVPWETHPLTPDRFEDFVTVVNRTRRPGHCWCLSHRLQAAEIEQLGAGSREAAMRRLSEREHPPGVLAYRDGVPVGWCNIGPRAEITRLARSRLIRPVDDLPVWSVVCVVVRPGHRRTGVTAPLLEGAVAYAASHGAPAVEAHPVDPVGRMDTTMAFVGTKAMFDRAGFRVIGTTDATACGMPRLIMRRDLTAG